MKFHEKLYTLRKAADMTQTDLAEKLDISRQAVSRWEMGTAMPDVDNLIAISDLFSVTLDDLLKNKEDVPEGELPPSKDKGPCYLDLVPRKWWIPLVIAVVLKLISRLLIFLMMFIPKIPDTWIEWCNQNSFTRILAFLISIPGQNVLAQFFLVLTAGCFAWALFKWLKARK